MSDNIKENKKKIEQLRKFMISQLRNSAWTPSGDGFSNKYLSFTIDSRGDWYFIVYYNSQYDTSARFLVYDFMDSFIFWFLRKFYVNSSIRDYEKLKKESQMASLSQNFFSKHKDIDRDSKLDQILN